MDLETSDRLIFIFVDTLTLGLVAVNDDIREVPRLSSIN